MFVHYCLIHILSTMKSSQLIQNVQTKKNKCTVPVLQGMVDPGEQVSLTLQREFSEEALNSLAVSPSEREKIHGRITKLFKSVGFQV